MGNYTDYGAAKHLMEWSPRAFKKAQDLVVAASKIDKPGFFVSQSTRRKTFFNLIVQFDEILFNSHIEQLERAATADNISVRAMLNGTNMVIEYMIMFRECFPNWKKEYDLIDRYSRQILAQK